MADVPDPFDLERFVLAQGGGVFESALAELAAGAKQGHWMWFVLPQLRSLGTSPRATHYGLTGLAEARAYVGHPVLGPRLAACVDALLALPGDDAVAVLGGIDAQKLRSCLTLFEAAVPTDPRFAAALSRFHRGQRCGPTLQMLRRLAR